MSRVGLAVEQILLNKMKARHFHLVKEAEFLDKECNYLGDHEEYDALASQQSRLEHVEREIFVLENKIRLLEGCV